MARKSIFDIASASINISNEVDRIVTMSTQEKTLQQSYKNYSVFEFVDEYCFNDYDTPNL